MNALRRLAFVLLFFPALAYFFLRWLVTGKSALAGLEALDKWGTK